MGLEQITDRLPLLHCQKTPVPSYNTLAISALTLLWAGADKSARSRGRLVMWENVSI